LEIAITLAYISPSTTKINVTVTKINKQLTTQVLYDKTMLVVSLVTDVSKKTSRCLEVHHLDVHGSVHYNTNLIEMTDKIQLCRTICYCTVP